MQQVRYLRSFLDSQMSFLDFSPCFCRRRIVFLRRVFALRFVCGPDACVGEGENSTQITRFIIQCGVVR